MPAQTEPIIDIFKRYGHPKTFARGERLRHGGLDGEVCLLTKGLGIFTFSDGNGTEHVLSLILPHRTMGDLDALDLRPVGLVAEFIRPSTVLALERNAWLEALRSDVRIMEAYLSSAILEHECCMEGMLSNFTVDLDTRLRILLHAIIKSHYQIRKDYWNPVPISLSITDIAKMVSANRSWVSRTVSSWVEAGLMRKDKRQLLVRSELFATEKLKRLCPE